MKATAAGILDRVLSNGQLPALPQSAIRLLELAKDARNGPSEFAVPIESDPGLMGQVLKFVNSSYFGFSREISSVKHAITLVGMRTVKNFVLWSAVFSLMPNPRCGPFKLNLLWQDSLRRALLGRLLAKTLKGADAEEVFAGALLQDMALPLLVKELPEPYGRLLEAREQGRARLSDLEQREFGWTHASLGGELARRWNLPDATAGLVELHGEADETLVAESAAAQIVAISALLPAAADGAWSECERFEQAVRRMSSGRVDAAELLAQVDIEFTDFAPVLKIAAPTRTLVESYRLALSGAM
jgi:HD-like signal output (HDOD) protein